MIGLKGNPENGAVPATVIADDCQKVTVGRMHGKADRRAKHKPVDLPFHRQATFSSGVEKWKRISSCEKSILK